MYPNQIIIKKRDRSELSKEEIFFFVHQITSNKVNDSQIGAFLMASVINGLSYEETANLTLAMSQSGKPLAYPKVKKPIVGKHSTGGVGDKTSMAVFPVCVALNMGFPKITARGLAYTGGTLDKLQSIVGFKTTLDQHEIDSCMTELGGFLVGPSNELAPADKKIYKIRDVTATVEEPALITSSILSKKVAEGLDYLVLDVKAGKGAFMKTIEKGRDLGSRLKISAELLGLKTKVVLSRMDQPLGKAVGNWLEVLEAEKFLKGESEKDLKDLVYVICTLHLMSTGLAKDKESADGMINAVIKNGEALKVFHKMIQLQGGNWEHSKAKYADTKFYEIKAEKSGWVDEIDAMKFGAAGVILGFSRNVEEDEIDHGTGFYFEKKRGDFVNEGECLYKMYARTEDKMKEAAEFLKGSITLLDHEVKAKDVIIDIM